MKSAIIRLFTLELTIYVNKFSYTTIMYVYIYKNMMYAAYIDYGKILHDELTLSGAFPQILLN